MRRKIVIIICIVLILAILIIRKDKTQENGNLANMGLVIQSNGVVYYNKYEKGIFSSKNGKEKQITDETAYSLNFYKNKIYYLTIADFNEVVIKSVDIDGENQKNIATVHTSISKICVENDFIYYASNKNGGGIAKINLQDKTETILLEGMVQDFQVVNNQIFYTNMESQICRVNQAGKDNVVLRNDINAKKIQVVNQWIYYYDQKENSLFRLSSNGKKKELISVLVNDEVYNVSGKYVYYLDKKNSQIARMRIGKSNQCDTIISIDVSKTKINIADDEIYYLDRSSNEAQTYQIYRIKTNGKKAQKIEY